MTVRAKSGETARCEAPAWWREAVARRLRIIRALEAGRTHGEIAAAEGVTPRRLSTILWGLREWKTEVDREAMQAAGVLVLPVTATRGPMPRRAAGVGEGVGA